MHGVMRPPTLHRNVKQYPEARQVDGLLLLLRIDAPLCFANDNLLKDTLVNLRRTPNKRQR